MPDTAYLGHCDANYIKRFVITKGYKCNKLLEKINVKTATTNLLSWQGLQNNCKPFVRKISFFTFKQIYIDGGVLLQLCSSNKEQKNIFYKCIIQYLRKYHR